MAPHAHSKGSPCAAALMLSVGCLLGCDSSPPSGAFDPTGTAADIYGEWDVNTIVPDAAACAAAGIDRVRLVFFPSIAVGATSYTDASFTLPCTDGFIDTGTMPVLRSGTFGYRWQALGADGSVLLESALFSLTTTQGQESVLQAVDFVRSAPMDIAVSLRFAGDLTYGTCAAAFATSMDWELRSGSATGPVVATSNGSEPCTEAFSILETSAVPIDAGGHVFIVHGSATDGSAWSAQCSWALPLGGPVAVQCDVPRAP